jgi:hypothetical protein
MVENPVERTLKLMRKHARRALRDDVGPWLGIGQINQMVGAKDRHIVRGYLIKLLARGDIELVEFSNGQGWRAILPPEPVVIGPEDVKDGVFILQREIREGSRSLWFDDRTFTNSIRAKRALHWEQQQALVRSRQWDVSERIQNMRILAVVKD